MNFKKALLVLWGSTTILCSMSPEDASLEARKLGERENKKLIQLFNKGLVKMGDQDPTQNALFNTNDVVPKKDQNKFLTQEDMETKLNKKDFGTSLFESELSKFVEKSDEKEEIEGTERYLTRSRVVMDHPDIPSGIILKPNKSPPEVDELATCQEGGVYQAFVSLRLNVEKSKKQKEVSVWNCKGHEIVKNFKSKKECEKFYDAKTKELLETPNMFRVAGWTEKHGFLGQKHEAIIYYYHVDSYKCDRCDQTIKKIDEEYEKDAWVPEDSEFYENLKKNKDCQLISETITEYGDTKTVNGNPVFREVWAKRLCFNCGTKESEDCRKLRENKGVLVGKLCLNENKQGQCDLWEKTYDMAGYKKAQLDTVLTRGAQLWGTGDEFDKAYEPNKDFGEVIATLSAFSDMKDELSEEAKDVNLNMRIFSGQAVQCKKNRFNNVFYDCCGTLDGGLIKLNFVDCSDEEKYLQEAKKEGKAVWVDQKKTFNLEGFSETNCYCIFPTKLARVVQQYARKKFPEYDSAQPFGNIESPRCEGLTLDQLTSLNFEEIDLSEVIQDFKQKTTQKNLGKKLNQLSQDISEDALYQKAKKGSKEYGGELP